MTDVQEVSAATRVDLRQFATLHAVNINQGFLTSLGPKVLEPLYSAFAEHARSHLYCVRDESGAIAGLAVTTDDLGGLYKLFARLHGRRVLPELLRGAAKRRAVLSIVETVSYPFRRQGRDRVPQRPDRGAERELINLCVDTRHRGSGHARRLMHRAISDFARDGGGTLKIVTGAHQTQAHGLYVSLGAVEEGRVEVHRGSQSIVYCLRVEPDASPR